MNFYEASRFQYAAARLMVKLSQFRDRGRFVKKITNNSNFDIHLVSQSDGSFNINVESPEQEDKQDTFVKVPIADLIAFVSERIVEKIDESALADAALARTLGASGVAFDKLVDATMRDETLPAGLSHPVQDLVRRRVAEIYREQRLSQNQSAISRIDVARGEKLIAMSAPLISEMATALRRSANTLEVTSSIRGERRSVLFLDQKMAQEIETAIVDDEITPILGDIIQFNKDNGWGENKNREWVKNCKF